MVGNPILEGCVYWLLVFVLEGVGLWFGVLLELPGHTRMVGQV